MTPADSPPPVHDGPLPATVRRFGFRAVILYLLLYNLPLRDANLTSNSASGVDAYSQFWHGVVPWVGEHLLHLATPITVFQNGSGDTTYNYVQLLCMLVVALVAAIAWSVAEPRGREARVLDYWVYVYVRYSLAWAMLAYGAVKVIKSQFPAPGLNHLLEPIGRASPMGLLWTMMGYSVLYNVFAGLLEMVGATLLFWRNTTLLGALLILGSLTNVVMLNFSYDVPVKLFSINLWLMAVFLLVPYRHRLWAALVTSDAPWTERESGSISPGAARGRIRMFRLFSKPLVIAAGFGLALVPSWNAAHRTGDLRPKPPLYGIYEVDRFTRDNLDVAPLTTDSTRWRYLVVNDTNALVVHLMNDSVRLYHARFDSSARRITSLTSADPAHGFAFLYSIPGAGRFVLTGTEGTDSLRISFHRLSADSFTLLSRGFHWISEYPFNR